MSQELKTVKEKKLAPETTVSQETQEFVKASELNPELASKLRTMKVELRKEVSRKGRARYFIGLPIEKRFLNPSFEINDAIFNKILLTLSMKKRADGKPVLALTDERGRELQGPFYPSAFYRFVKGPKNETEEYYSIEIIFAKGLVYRYFFGSNKKYEEIDNVKMLDESGKVSFNWEYQPEKLEVTENPQYE